MPKRNQGNQTVARGRGNQGDWANNKPRHGTLPEHVEHNSALESKRKAKQSAKRAKRALAKEGK